MRTCRDSPATTADAGGETASGTTGGCVHNSVFAVCLYLRPKQLTSEHLTFAILPSLFETLSPAARIQGACDFILPEGSVMLPLF